MLSHLSFCFLVSEILAFKAPNNIIYSTLWRQTHQHSGSPDPSIRFLLAFYRKPTMFNEWEIETLRHNGSTSKQACVFAMPTRASQPFTYPFSLRGTTGLFTSKRPAVLSPCSHPCQLLPTHRYSWFSILHFIPLEEQNFTWHFHFLLVPSVTFSPSALENDTNPAAPWGSNCTGQGKL